MHIVNLKNKDLIFIHDAICMSTCSVLMTTYDAETFIAHTIQSILWQTFSDIEILIVDNNSHDNTVAVLKKIASKDARVTIYESKENFWPYGWLNFLLQKAQWKYIAIIDHDDIWHPEKLRNQIVFLEKNPSYVWCWSTFTDIREGENFCKHELYRLPNVVLHSSLVFRNKWYTYNVSNKYADRDFMVHVLAKDWPIHHMDEAFVLRRIRAAWKNISVTLASFTWLFKRKRIYWVPWYEYIYNILRFKYAKLYRVLLYICMPSKITKLTKLVKTPLRKDYADFITKAFN